MRLITSSKWHVTPQKKLKVCLYIKSAWSTKKLQKVHVETYIDNFVKIYNSINKKNCIIFIS
jgi:hypothetical protein